MSAKRKKPDEDHVCPAVEAYLMTYSDMITALLVLFIVLFAMGQIDISKFEKFKQGIARSGATPIDDGLLENGEGVFEQAMIRPEFVNSPDDQDGPGGLQTDAVDATAPQRNRFDLAQAQIADALQQVNLGTEVTFRTETRGLVITIVSDAVLFDPGSASLTGDGDSVVNALATGLVELPNRISIEGHTDSTPINTARFPSNWELSVGRASTVLRTLVESHGMPGHRVSAAGYADQRPIASNATAPGRAANRRVEIVVHSQVEETPTFGEGG